MTAQATTTLRAITYNLAGRRDVTAQLTLCDRRGWDVLLVQEATAATIPKLAAPPASSGWGDKKVDQLQAYARRFESRDRPLLVGVDANAPKHDHLDERRSEWWWPEEAEVWGHHGLVWAELHLAR